MNPAPKRPTGRDLPEAATYTIGQLAAKLKCSPRHIHRLVSQDAVPGVLKFGKLLRFRKAVIDRWLGTP